ncbi:SAM-dependent methlyltransferase [Knoellia sinensis KCTC 19936]|uniref:SAM-dependent methlyltransferase n=1 Tax=Knoellia sinensis KCTC 19936 TaxID=1385520 RepID=A0A0A0JAX8_9MICO|nr:bifunctional 2-polyprenyl-6-hydroxyphenol methylase/3-demethylubiquinol 3-O-methyltransferase UbiG [Knoellia sinensis]KGN34308.1 SAM-dependent methlyltransferase [Knoellia sinensis KCTC 19936]
MPIDNEIYDREGAGWWDEDNPLNILHGSFTPGRITYFRDVFHERGMSPDGLRALDIGCGGGFMAEEFAQLGCDVVGVDPSEVSIESARAHAQRMGLDIDYRVGSGESLPVADGDFDIAYCCDVLEHVSDVDAVLRETSRCLKPGGLYLFDTINRTRQSRLLAIKVMQEWRLTRIINADIHDWDMFITPDELDGSLAGAGLRLHETVGLGPRASKPSLVWNFVRAHRGAITFGELSRRLEAGQVKSKALSYMGYATKVA